MENNVKFEDLKEGDVIKIIPTYSSIIHYIKIKRIAEDEIYYQQINKNRTGLIGKQSWNNIIAKILKITKLEELFI